MLAHDLAKELLSGPNLPIAVPNVQIPESDVSLCDPEITMEEVGQEDGEYGPVEHVVIVPKSKGTKCER